MKAHFFHEVWRPAIGWEGLYEVSSKGRIKRLYRETSTTRGGKPFIMRFQEKILKPDVDKDGYHVYRFCSGERKEIVKAHRAVLMAFGGSAPEDRVVAHIDGDPQNNCISNLRYATCKENHQDRERHGRTAKGERHGKAKLTEKQIKEIRESSETTNSLAKKYGVSFQHIARIKERGSWSHVA